MYYEVIYPSLNFWCPLRGLLGAWVINLQHEYLISDMDKYFLGVESKGRN